MEFKPRTERCSEAGTGSVREGRRLGFPSEIIDVTDILLSVLRSISISEITGPLRLILHGMYWTLKLRVRDKSRSIINANILRAKHQM